jgi:hypothetical protein
VTGIRDTPELWLACFSLLIGGILLVKLKRIRRERGGDEGLGCECRKKKDENTSISIIL